MIQFLLWIDLGSTKLNAEAVNTNANKVRILDKPKK